jgi:hypothetical protein
MEGFVAGIGISCIAILTIPVFRKNTWVVWPGMITVSLCLAHTALYLLPSHRREKKRSHRSISKSLNMPSFKVAPGIGDLLDPVAVLARSELFAADSICNKPEFCPPREQPRAEKLKWVADLLQNAMFKNVNGGSTMNGAVASVIAENFVPAAKAHFAECVEQARDMVPEMRDRYHDVRRGHLAIYQDTLDQIRGENAFVELQKRSDKLVVECKKLNRPKEQKATSICGLYNGAEAVFTRFDAVMTSVASKTGTKFHPAPRKGLLRICEKLALVPEWQPECGQSASNSDLVYKRGRWHPERVMDVTRGYHFLPPPFLPPLPPPPPIA